MSIPSRATRLCALRELAFFVVCAGTALPLWIARYLPLQDLPQHLAAIRVLSSYGDPAYGFEPYFEVDLSRTQYLLYYVLAKLLAVPFGVELGNRLLVSACLVGTPYALRSLLRALGRDERLALFSLPLAYNAHLILGFFNFLLAIPLSLYALSLAVRQRVSPRTSRALWLSLLLVACFYAHIVPFALSCLGIGLVGLERSPSRSAKNLLPLLPSALLSSLWSFTSPAGRATLSAARGGKEGPTAYFQPARDALRDLPNWLTNVLQGEQDETLALWYFGLLGVTAVLGVLASFFARPPSEPPQSALQRSLTRRLWLLPPFAALLYFVAPTAYDWIWPIAQRFPLLALLFGLAVWPMPPRWLGAVLLAGALVLTTLTVRLVGEAFVAFDRDEVGDFEAALAAIPPRSRVAGLIFTRGSRHVRFSPFIHFVAYQQARKGGVVMFTFADFPQSPFHFRPERRPPRVPPRWEWTPERVQPRELAFYDYVLARGGPGAVARADAGFTPVYRGKRYSVWRRLP